MNNSRNSVSRLGLAISVCLLAACASSPQRPSPELQRLQSEVERLQGDTRIAAHADEEISRADNAVESLVRDERKLKRDTYDHRLYLADRLVQVAEAEGLGRYAEARGLELGRDRDRLTAEARAVQLRNARNDTAAAQQSAQRAMSVAERERMDADAARRQTSQAMSSAERERMDAEAARQQTRQAMSAAEQAKMDAEDAASRAEQARLDASGARQGEAQALSVADAERAAAAQQRAIASDAQASAAQARLESAQARRDKDMARDELEAVRAQLSDLQTKTTERGLVVTLGDVLFELDRAELKAGGQRSLDQLVSAIQSDEEVQLTIEGHTDSTGSRDHNMDLSKRRAATVSQYLSAHGVAAANIQSSGLGPDFPVASNGTEAGRQQNRRVEVIVKSPVARVSQNN